MRHWAVGVLLCAMGAAFGQRGSGAQEGLKCPSFSGRPVNGKAVDLKGLIEKAGAVIALADPRSREGGRLIAFLQQSQDQLIAKNVGVVIICAGFGQESSVQNFAKQNKITVPLVPDGGRRLTRLFGLESGAMVVVVNKEGTIVRRVDATLDTADLGPQAMAAVEAMVAAQKAAEEQGTAIPEGTEPAAGDTTQGEGATPKPKLGEPDFRKRVVNGWRLIQNGHFSAALEDARTLAQQQGRDFGSLLWLSYTLEVARQYPEAAVTYRQVLALRPGHLYSLQAIGRIDPEGRYKTAADLPKPEPEEKPAETRGATTSEGPASIGG
ncbi:MAG: redoxin domain-containing protein [Armatimonadetes bacterium]|nr:redoxin domain-containing protein [Armatimonadota bacterium]